MDRATKQTITAMPPGLSYSYQDGDLPFVWSPDSRWLAATTGSAVTSFDVSLIDASSQKPPVNLTRSGFHAVEPLFSPDGQAVYYQSARDGLQTADSKAAQTDVYATFLTQAAYDAAMHPADQIAAPPATSAEPGRVV
jgi:tricorn protease